MATKKTIIGCNKFNDKSAISNSNFTTNLKQSLTLNEGDTISVKTSFIDTRNKIAGYYSIAKDVIISMDYYFYYINRGGNQIISNQIANEPGNPTQKQCIACDNPPAGKNIRDNSPFPAFIENPNEDSFYSPESDKIGYSQYITNNHTAYKNQTIPVSNDTTPTGKIPANLSPLLESIYHCYSNVNIDNIKPQYTINGNFDQSAFSNNPSGFNTVIDTQSGDGLPYLLHYFIPENINKNYNVLPINISDMVIGQTYSIIDTGLPWDGGFNTDWINLSSTFLSNTPIDGINFICDSNANNEFTFTDISKFDTINSFTIINSIGFDFSLYGGPSLPTNTNPIISMYKNVVAGKWYKFIAGITPNFLDGSVLSLYNEICGIPPNIQPSVGDMFVAVADYPTTDIIINNNNINIISPGTTIEVVVLGLINWELFGYINPHPTNDIDITKAEINVNYKVITTGDNWGLNNQFKQSSNNSYIDDIINLTSPYVPQTITLPTFNPTQLQPAFNGEYFIIINSGTGTNEWQQYFDLMPGNVNDEFEVGNVIIAKNIVADMSGLDTTVVLQWFQLNGIQVGTTITVSNLSIVASNLLQLMGYTNNNTFITTHKLNDFDIAELDYLPNPNTGLPSLTASITFIEPNMLLRNNQIPTPFQFIVTKNPGNFTDATYEAYIIPNISILEMTNYTFPLPSFKPTSQIIGGYNSSFESAVVSTAKVGTQNLKTNIYDNKALNTGKMKPFTKNFKFKIKAGSYSPEYLAEILSRAMAVQKPKQNTKNGKIKISTPVVNITEQMIDKATLQTEAKNALIYNDDVSKAIAQWNNDGYSGITGFGGGEITNVNNLILLEMIQVQNIPCPSNHPYLHQGGFPYTAPNQIDTYANLPPLWQNYIPNNQFVPKNQNILPSGQNLDDTKLPINPKYDENDFNYNASLTGDDTPFLYRPNAYGTRSDFDSTQMNIKLTYNDANLEYINDLLPFGKQADNSIRNIEMAYKPLCHDATSDYFENIQNSFNLTETTDYSIRPVVSVPFTQIGVSLQYQNTSSNNYTSCVPSGIRNIASPIVGSTQMSMTYNDENNNLFSFPYLHTGIYSKADPTTNATVESIGIYKNSTTIITTDINGQNPIRKKVNSVFQAESQSGILLKNLKATYVDGSTSTFWEDLGFDLNAITAQNNKLTYDDDTFQISYNDFLNKTTRGFSGTANIFDNQTKSDLNEISPISFYDSYTMSGYHLEPATSNNIGLTGTTRGVYSWFYSNYILYNQPLYFSVEKTKSIDASRNFTNLNDTGHVLLSVEGYNGNLINSETKMNIKSIISSYYSSSNFITNPNSEDIIYEHVGEPLDINSLKIVLIDPFTNQEVENIGPNSSIYFSVSQQLQFQNKNK